MVVKMDEKDLVSQLWESDAASALTNAAAREIDGLRENLAGAVAEAAMARTTIRDRDAEIRGLKLTLAQIEMRTSPAAAGDTIDDLKRDLRHANSLARMGLKSPHP